MKTDTDRNAPSTFHACVGQLSTNGLWLAMCMGISAISHLNKKKIEEEEEQKGIKTEEIITNSTSPSREGM